MDTSGSQPTRSRFDVLGTQVDAVTVPGAIERLRALTTGDGGAYVVFGTVSTILSALDDPDVSTALAQADLVAPDGMPLVWLGRRRPASIERVYGPDLMIDFIEATGAEFSHYFFGGRDGVTTDLVANLRRRFPELRVAGHHEPPFLIDADQSAPDIARIDDSGADVVWVGLGHPKQELWMWRNRDRTKARLLLGVGAAFDFHAGRKREAPRWMKNAGLQWLHRLVKEPRRLWRRYLVGNTRFVWLLLRSRFGRTPT